MKEGEGDEDIGGQSPSYMASYEVRSKGRYAEIEKYKSSEAKVSIVVLTHSGKMKHEVLFGILL